MTGHVCAPSMSLAELLGNGQGEDLMLSGLQLDSRKVRPGDLFLALPGEVHDGRQFIEQAIANGAVAVLAEAPVGGFIDELSVPVVEIPELAQEAGSLAASFLHNPSREMYTVGVTGTNGKTTTARLVAQLARAVGQSFGVMGTLGASLGDDGSLTETGFDAPPAFVDDVDSRQSPDHQHGDHDESDKSGKVTRAAGHLGNSSLAPAAE